jgi:hypothetical protein
VAWVSAALCGLAAVYAGDKCAHRRSQTRALADQANAQETAPFCRKHAMPPGSDAYPARASDLMEIRNRQEARFLKLRFS